MALGKGCPGYFLAVGNHIPANTPVANALYYNQVYEDCVVAVADDGAPPHSAHLL